MPRKPHDPVNSPDHYTQHPSGIECIEITEDMGFNLGNAFKYCFRDGKKNGALDDKEKALWYLDREIARVKNMEVWAPYPKDERYEVSTLGRVRFSKTGHIRKLVPIKNGYFTFLTYTDDTYVLNYVHRAVLLTFAGEPDTGMHAAHNNGNKANNRLDNLRWASPSENAKDRLLHGTANRGSRNGKSVLTEEQAREISALKGGASEVEVAELFGVSHSTIGRIWRGESWNITVPPVTRFLADEQMEVFHAIWGAHLSGALDDLEKARWHVEREISRRSRC